MLLMLLVVLLCCPRPSRANEGNKKFQLQAILCSTPEWSLLETLVTAPLVGSYNVQNSSPLQKLLSRFIPVSGTLEVRADSSAKLFLLFVHLPLIAPIPRAPIKVYLQ